MGAANFTTSPKITPRSSGLWLQRCAVLGTETWRTQKRKKGSRPLFTLKAKVGEGEAVREQPTVREFAAKSVALITREVCRRFGVKENERRGKL